MYKSQDGEGKNGRGEVGEKGGPLPSYSLVLARRFFSLFPLYWAWSQATLRPLCIRHRNHISPKPLFAPGHARWRSWSFDLTRWSITCMRLDFESQFLSDCHGHLYIFLQASVMSYLSKFPWRTKLPKGCKGKSSKDSGGNRAFLNRCHLYFIFLIKSVVMCSPDSVFEKIFKPRLVRSTEKIGSLRSNDAAATKTSLKKWICDLSVFIAIIAIHLLCQM